VTSGIDDLDRLRAEYADRDRRLAGSGLYSPLHPANLFAKQQRLRVMLSLLRRHGFESLADKRVLEIGCGRGGILSEFLVCGASPEQLHGAELLPNRLADARARLPRLPLTCADGQNLPYRSGSFDLVVQFTVFSSVLDRSIKRNIAQEMLRVLRRPDGVILWYDFWLNPTNRQTRGVRPAEIRELFPGCEFDSRRITLAPPIARRLVGISRAAAAFLERIKLLNTHYLVAIRPKG
jgi:SAM-dependent methyltransferase